MRDRVFLEERNLVAPFSGWISRTLKEEGEAVDEFEPIAVLVRLDPIWIELNVAAEHFGRTSVDDPAVVRVGRLEKEARVVVVDPVVDAGSLTFRVKLEIDNEEGILVAGTMAVVELSLHGPASETVTGARVAGRQTPKRAKGSESSIILGSDKSKSNKPSSSPNQVEMKPLLDGPIWTTEQHDGSPPAG
jgi:multidrug efflux pump subunit AcrA (membrane-fusion protein)